MGGQQFLVGDELGDEIRKILAEHGVRCAVAFWGAGAETLVTGTDARIICNLRMGGTNPFAMRMVKADIRKRDDLHAKVYLGKNKAIVASANASANGLGLEGVEQAGWVEAGTLTDDVAPIAEWFEALWNGSQQVVKADWAAAERAWRARTKPTLTSFDSFDPEADDLPLVNWITWGDWEVCPEAIAVDGVVDEGLLAQVERGLELEHPDDKGVLAGRWVLTWTRGRQGPPPPSRRPWWVRLGHATVREAFRVTGEERKRDVVIAVETMPPVPFDPTERRFVTALRDVLLRPEYADLLVTEYDPPWFKTREPLMRSLWRDVKIAYRES
jgi:hypothetical protein